MSRIKNYASRFKKWFYNHKGFLTYEDMYISWARVHALGIGMIDGFSRPHKDHKKRLKKWRELHEDVDKHPHYFTKGFPQGQFMFLAAGIIIVWLIYVLVIWTQKSF